MGAAKWITDLSTTTPIADAARHVLAIRLETLRDRLVSVVHEAAGEPEAVHQLRVASRRADAALKTFRPCLKRKGYRSVRKNIRRLRRAAGAARDADVFLARLTAGEPKPTAGQRAGFDFLSGHAVSERMTAQAQLQDVCREHPFVYERMLTKAMAAVHHPADGPTVLRDLAHSALTDLLQKLDAATQQELDDYDHLHEIRVLGKRLRYAMEIFGDCFAPSFREHLYPAIEEMQEILGRLNDSHVSGQRLQALRDRVQEMLPKSWKRLRAGIEVLVEAHEHRQESERHNFLEWRAKWRSGGHEAFLTTLRDSAQ